MSALALACCVVDLKQGLVQRHGCRVRLTTREAELLAYLAARAGRTVSRAELLRDVWGFHGRLPASRAPDFAILRLRTKIERDPEDPRHILTVHGTGYRFEPLPEGAVPDLEPLPEAPPDLFVDVTPSEEETELIPIESRFSCVSPAATPAVLQPSAPFRAGAFLGRQAERRVAELLLAQPGAPVVVQGAAGFGKTWFLHALCQGLPGGDRVLPLDLRHFDRPTLACSARFFRRLYADLGDLLEAGNSDLGNSDLRNSEAGNSGLVNTIPDGDPARVLTRLLEREALSRGGRTLLLLDHADEARHLDNPSALFALLRAWSERVRPPWDRLRLLIAVSTEPGLLVEEPHLSPFNLSPAIRLGDLDRAEVVALVTSSGLEATEAVIDTLLALVGGHPRLLRTACFAAASADRSLAEVLSVALSDGGCFGDVLHRRLRVLRGNMPLAATLLATAGAPGGRVDPALARRLEAAGLLRRVAGGWRPRDGLTTHLTTLL